MTVETLFNTHFKRSDSTSTAESEMALVTCGKLHGYEFIPEHTMKRSVTFDQDVVVRTCIHINDYSEKEINNTWFRREEYRMMRASCATTVRAILDGKYAGDTEQISARGVENKTPTGSRRRKTKRLECLVAVMDEQEQQFLQNQYDPLALAGVYMQRNRASRFEASHRGELDAEEVSRLWSGKESITTIPGNRSRSKSPKGRAGKGILDKFRRNQKERKV